MGARVLITKQITNVYVDMWICAGTLCLDSMLFAGIHFHFKSDRGFTCGFRLFLKHILFIYYYY